MAFPGHDLRRTKLRQIEVYSHLFEDVNFPAWVYQLVSAIFLF